MPSTSTDLGMWQTPMFLVQLEAKGEARWSPRAARGPFPVAWPAMMKPMKATIARRPFLISWEEEKKEGVRGV